MNKQILFAVLLSVFISSAAVAQTTYAVSVGNPADNPFLQTGDLVVSSFASKQSYCCTFINRSIGDQVGVNTTVKDPSANDVTGVARGETTPAVAVNPMSDMSPDDNRICLFAEEAGNHTFTLNAPGHQTALDISCDRSSISGGFNTNGTPFNFLECLNRSNKPIAIRVFAIDFAGTVLVDGDLAANQLTLNAGIRTDIDIHTPVGADKFGEVRVLHDGPKGAVSCKLSRYTSSLDLKDTSPLD